MPQPQTEREALQLAERAAEVVIPRLIPPQLRLFLNAAMDVYQLQQRLQGLFAKGPKQYKVDPSVWEHAPFTCAQNLGDPWDSGTLGAGGCGERHEMNGLNDPVSEFSLYMHFEADRVPGVFAEWSVAFSSMYERISGYGTKVGIETLLGNRPLPAPRPNPWPDLNPFEEPVEWPGTGVRPTPKPVPWSVTPHVPDYGPDGDPSPRPSQRPAQRPLTRPWEMPYVTPINAPGLPPLYLKAYDPGTQVEWRSDGKTQPEKSQHQNVRPINRGPLRTKERKFILGPAANSVPGIIISAVTEADDFVDDLWNALPKDKRSKAKRFKGADGKWHLAKVSERDRLGDVLTGFNAIDMKQAFKNVVRDQITDAIFGRLGKVNAKAQQNVHDTGYGPGIRNAGNPSNIANRGQVPTSGSPIAASARTVLTPIVNRYVDYLVGP